VAIYTPTGLKIRFPIPYAFGLMARLEPRVTPFRVLMTTEGLELLPNTLCFFAGLVCFWYGATLWDTFCACTAAVLLGMLMNIGQCYLPGVVAISRLYAFASVWEVITLAAIVLGVVVSGWGSAAGFALAYGGVLVWEFLEDSILAKRVPTLNGVPLVGPERNFITACRLLAGRNELLDIVPEDSEWKESLARFGAAWPQVVRQMEWQMDD